MIEIFTSLKYLNDLNKDFKDRITLFDLHVQRLQNGLVELNNSSSKTDIDEQSIIVAVKNAVEESRGQSVSHRVRVSVNPQTLELKALASSLTSMPDYPVNVTIDIKPSCTSSKLLQIKTTDRQIYEDAKKRNNVTYSTDKEATFDTLLYNEQGFITETTIANILYKFKNESIWHTPPITDGLLPGLERCKQLCDGNCKERSLSLDELKLTLETDNIDLRCCNAIRGVYEIKITH